MKEKIFDLELEGSRIVLRKIVSADVNKNYVNWMNDPEVVKYTESRFREYTADDLKSYIKKVEQEGTSIFLAMILKRNNEHIGNIKIGPINWIHGFADVALIIGNKDLWGEGYATEAIELVINYSFNQLRLHKLTAGIYANNLGSLKAFKNTGFIEEGIKKRHFLFRGKYIDGIFLAIINEKRET